MDQSKSLVRLRTARRAVATFVATLLLAVVLVGPAAAFEPPADPAEVFDGGGPTGHPGAPGQSEAFLNGAAETRAAWNAHDHAEPITN